MSPIGIHKVLKGLLKKHLNQIASGMKIVVQNAYHLVLLKRRNY